MEDIFEKYYKDEEFMDRKAIKNEIGVDVILPIYNTNPLFEKNLISFYREIPINRLIVGDGGSTDDSIKILSKFPRVKLIDQSHLNTLGFCLVELISNVETDWFIYLHSDVYLPESWYDKMKPFQNKYDWFECGPHITTLINYELNLKHNKRSYSGSQMGRKKAFENIINIIDDDFLYRNEDIIFQELIILNGYKWGRIPVCFHYHQVLNKRGKKEPEFKKVTIERYSDKQWEIKTNFMQVKGIIKYLKPKIHLIKAVNININLLKIQKAIDINKFKKWVEITNKEWLKFIEFKHLLLFRLLRTFQNYINILFRRIYNLKLFQYTEKT